jgi:hypothetical protein
VLERFYVDWDIRAIMLYAPEVGSFYDPASDNPAMYGLKLQDIAFSPNDNQTHAFVDLTYAPNSGGAGVETSLRDGDPDYSLDGAMIEKAIDLRDGYLVNWNYNLAAKVGTTAVPSWWATATTTGNQTDPLYAWTKDDPPAAGSDGIAFYQLRQKTKPGVELYQVPAPVVNERRWYTDKAAADSAAALVGTRGTPGDTFGRTTGEWLRMPNRLFLDGKRWQLEQPWQWAESWDHDLYD